MLVPVQHQVVSRWNTLDHDFDGVRDAKVLPQHCYILEESTEPPEHPLNVNSDAKNSVPFFREVNTTDSDMSLFQRLQTLMQSATSREISYELTLGPASVIQVRYYNDANFVSKLDY